MLKYNSRKLSQFLLILVVTIVTVVTGNINLLLALPKLPPQNYYNYNTKETGDRLLQLGITQQKKGQLWQAVDTLRQALTIYENIADRQGEANALLNLGEIYFNLGEYRLSIDFYQHSLDIFKKLGDRPTQANILDALANAYIYIEKDKVAQQLRKQADALRKEIGNPPQEASFLGNVGITYQSVREYKQAIIFYQQQFAKSQKQEDRPGQIYALNQLEKVYQESGEYKEANTFYTQELAKAKKAGDNVAQAYFLSQLGLVYQKLGQYPQAIKFYQEQLELARKLGDVNTEILALSGMGKAYENQGKYPEAIEIYQQYLEVARKTGNSDAESNALNKIANVYIAQKQFPQALAFYQQQLAIAKDKNDKFTAGKIFNNIGLVMLKAGKLEDAKTNLNEALNSWEALRVNPENKDNYFSDRDITYNFLQQLLIAQQKPEEALEMAEQAKLRHFFDLLKIRLPSEPQRVGWNLANPRFKFITIPQIKQVAIEQKATLVAYSIISDETIYIWVVTPDGKIAFRPLDITKENTIYSFTNLENIVNSLNAALAIKTQPDTANKNIDKETQNKPLLQLNQLLINPIKDILPQDPNARVIFIPSKELLQVPFPALIDIYGKYLIEKHTIAVTPAIKYLNISRQQKRNFSGNEMLLVGNPTMPSIPPAVGKTPQPLPPIANAEQEVLEIAQLFKAKPPLTGNKATKAALLPLLPKAHSIHFATYTLLDDFKWMGLPGAIALTPFGTDNGLFTASEILELYPPQKSPRLQAQLVVFSRGGIFPPIGDVNNSKIAGEGVMGMSAALLSAGVTTIVLPLWSAPEKPTTFFITEFYKQLKQKRDKAQALKNASIATMKQYPNPRDWAGFILIGECK